MVVSKLDLTELPQHKSTSTLHRRFQQDAESIQKDVHITEDFHKLTRATALISAITSKA